MSEGDLRKHDLVRILELCRRMNAQRDVSSLFDFVTREAARLLDAERASIFLLDAERMELWSRVAMGTDEVLRFDARLGLAGDVLLNRRIVNIEDAYLDDRFNPAIDAQLGYRTRSVLAVPLVNESGETIGVFQVLNKRRGRFSEDDVGVLTTLAGHTAIAAQTALLLDRLEKERNHLLSENRRLRDEVRGRFSTRNILGMSPPIQKLVRQIEDVADTDIEVLITGESGTGKELVARAIHFSGGRADGPFLAINCASLPESLVEAELFGIEKGVATGVVQRPGKFESAAGGTLFLDEIGDLSLSAQAKILRVLQERVVERVGGREPIRVDVRVVAATNKDLEAAIRNGAFRDDLYYRLKVIHLKTPALRETREDIPLLAQHFLARYCRELERPSKSWSAAALKALTAYDWPGNVRELENEVKRLVVTVRRPEIRETDLSDEIRRGCGQRQGIRQAVEDVERNLIREALAASGGNRAQAAARLGLSRQGLLKKMQRLGLAGF
jgi:Nif-specific regulatory protein